SPWKRSTRRAENVINNNDQYEHQYSLNSLWSIWYGTIAIAFQIYIVVISVKRFTSYVSLEWPNDQPPYKELNAYVILIGVGVVVLPFFVVSAMMKIGNNANDGTKIGAEKPNYDEEAVYENIHCTLQSNKREHKLRWMLLIWKHSLPTVALLHTLAALCFLISRLLMDAQVIKYGFLEKGLFKNYLLHFKKFVNIFLGTIFCFI
ncbi:Protein tincar-like protein, partial [Leptotrombidium deliense]